MRLFRTAQRDGVRLAFAVLVTASPAIAHGLLAQDRVHAGADTAKKAPKVNLGPLRRIEFDTDEGTWTNVDVSPVGRTVLFDLLGDLYTIPIGGGDAKLLLGGRDWDQMPRYSPDGKQIAFISDRDGNMNLWVANADGTHLRQLSKDFRYPFSSPLWSPDGTIIARKIARPNTELWAFSPLGGSGYKLAVTGTIAGPGLSPDGRFFYLSGIRRLDRMPGDPVMLGQGDRPTGSPAGRS